MTEKGRWNFVSSQSGAELQLPHLPQPADPPYLEAALEHKEEQLVLAAQLGKALLEENEELRAENRRLQERNTHTMKETEQQQYWLVQRSEGREKEWESRACELETGMKAMQAEMQRLHKVLQEVEREKDGIKESFGEQNQILAEKLQQALLAEKALAVEVSNLRTECQDKAMTEKWDSTRILTLQDEVERESLQKLDLEQQISSTLQVNEVLQAQVEVLRAKIFSLEKRSQELLDQVMQSERDSEDVRMLNRALRAQLEELQEETFLGHSEVQNGSLLSEMEQSIDKGSWYSERQQVSAEIQAVCHELEACEVAPLPPCVITAQAMLSDLAQSLEHGTLADQAHEESLSYSLQAQKLQAEKTLQQAIQERDDAITKKTAVELELSRCRSELSSLNKQLLEAVQVKVHLSQELEAWQEDMQRVISEQVQKQQRLERSAPIGIRRADSQPEFLHRSREKGFFSLFKF